MDGALIETRWSEEWENELESAQVLTRYLKQQVGDGLEFSNEVVRAVLSQRGCYYQFVELPEEFSAALGEFSYRFVGWQETFSLLEQLYWLPYSDFLSKTRELSLLVVYDRLDAIADQSIYAYHYERGNIGHHDQLLVRGRVRRSQLPRFFKLRLVAESILDGIGFSSGMAFFIANPGESHLLVQVPYPASSISALFSPQRMQ